MPLFNANPTPVRIVNPSAEANLGYFDDFMRAWGLADPATRATVYAETIDYRTGAITGQAEVDEVSRSLGIASAPNVIWPT